jgi:hypothetical protein
VTEIFPAMANITVNATLPKIDGSEAQRRTAIFSLGAFFRAHVGKKADRGLATQVYVLEPLLSRFFSFCLFRQDSSPVYSNERFLSVKQDLVLQQRFM